MVYMNTFAVSSSDFQKQYKTVVERVRQTKQPALLTSKKEPQAVLISLEDYATFQAYRRRDSAKNLLAWVQDVRELLKDEQLPPDLSARHDYYLWEEASVTT
jgi:prevent-host-death family protein